ncbi:MAG: Holliday junction resolvase RuvX [Pseudomonadota bacterium]
MAQTDDLTVEQFARLLQGKGRLLGLDLGSKTIGLAICDDRWSIASPVHTIRRRKFTLDVEDMLAYAAKEGVVGLVIGLPLNMDGSEGPRAQSTRAFVRNLSKHTSLPVLYWDERLSSFAADQAMLEADLSRAKRAKNIDQMAAAVILQGAIDRMSAIAI